MSDCFVLYLLLTCMKKKTSGADKFTNNTSSEKRIIQRNPTSLWNGETTKSFSAEALKTVECRQMFKPL